MPYPKMIGICGDIGSGKSYSADYLHEKHGYDHLAWAEPLKEVCYYIYGPMGAERRHFFGTQADKNEPLHDIRDKNGAPLTGRKIMEWLGTEGYRGADPDTWVKWTMAVKVTKIAIQGDSGTWFFKDPNRIVTPEEVRQRQQRFVVGDVRFQNEADAIHSKGGVIVEVIRTGHTSQRTGHASDEEWREIPKDFVIEAASGDLDGLYRRWDEVLGA
jgi:hypothetical protein